MREGHFARLADGRDPLTDELLVRHQTPHISTNSRGETVRTMEHRAGWDLTFSAPKSVSLTALVGDDERVREAHRESVRVALRELEAYTQARLGGNHAPETTGRWIAATFEHDSARPVDGYAAPQLHTHAVVFNLTRCENGDIRPVQPQELYRSQQFATAVYRSELASRLTSLGYEIERGRSGQPEIGGYTREYLEASSPRRQQIEDHLERGGYQGARAAEIAAHQTREAKDDCSRDEMQARHRDLAEAFGNQPSHVRETAHERELAREREGALPDREKSPARAHDAVTYAKAHNLEREAVVEERDMLRDALTRGMGDVTIREVREDFEQRIDAREFLPVERSEHEPGRAFTTPEMIALERETIDRMHAGQDREPPLARDETRDAILDEHRHLNDGQREAIAHILRSHDQILGLDGRAGVGKTTTLTAIRDAAEREGIASKGLRPRRAPRMNLKRPASTHARCRRISNASTTRQPANGTCTCLMSQVWSVRGRCTISSNGSTARIACYWSATPVSIRLSRQDAPSSSCARLAWMSPTWTESCANASRNCVRSSSVCRVVRSAMRSIRWIVPGVSMRFLIAKRGWQLLRGTTRSVRATRSSSRQTMRHAVSSTRSSTARCRNADTSTGKNGRRVSSCRARI